MLQRLFICILSSVIFTAPAVLAGWNSRDQISNNKKNDITDLNRFNLQKIFAYNTQAPSYFHFNEDMIFSDAQLSKLDVYTFNNEVYKKIVALKEMYPELNFNTSVEDLAELDKVLRSIQSPYQVIFSTLKNTEADQYYSKDVFDLTEALIMKILSTPTGGKICTQITNGQRADIQFKFGITKTSAQKLRDTTCPKSEYFEVLLSKLILYNQSSYDYEATSKYPLLPIFNYVLYYKPVNLPMQSWTSVQHTDYRHSFLKPSLIFISPDQLSIDYLIKAMTHEIAIRNDYLNQVTPRFLTDSIEDSNFRTKLLILLSHPQIRMTLSMIRAFDIEYKILRELDLINKDEFNQFIQMSPYEKLVTYFPLSAQYVEILEQENLMLTTHLNQTYGQSYLDKDLSELKDLFEITATHPITKKQDKIGKLLTEGLYFNANISDQMGIDSYFHPGPRPPIGRGTGTEISTLNQMTAQDILKTNNQFKIKTQDSMVNSTPSTTSRLTQNPQLIESKKSSREQKNGHGQKINQFKKYQNLQSTKDNEP